MLDSLHAEVLPAYRAAVDEELKRLRANAQAGFSDQVDPDLALLPDRERIGGPSLTAALGSEPLVHSEAPK